jgi:hypothetical protein
MEATGNAGVGIRGMQERMRQLGDEQRSDDPQFTGQRATPNRVQRQAGVLQYPTGTTLLQWMGIQGMFHTSSRSGQRTTQSTASEVMHNLRKRAVHGIETST